MSSDLEKIVENYIHENKLFREFLKNFDSGTLVIAKKKLTLVFFENPWESRINVLIEGELLETEGEPVFVKGEPELTVREPNFEIYAK